jgi:peroxidase
MTALSGAHTVGFAQCRFFRGCVYGDANIDPAFAGQLRGACSAAASDDTDAAGLRQRVLRRPGRPAQATLLHSDQVLFSGGLPDALVLVYSVDSRLFFADIAAAMVKLGSISPLTGTDGEIRAKCSVVNNFGEMRFF